MTYHAVVAVRYPSLCRLVNGRWELGSFASGGIPTTPPGFQMVLWDTNSNITGLVAADLEAIVGKIIPDFADSIEFADGLFVMTTATHHKKNLTEQSLSVTMHDDSELKPLQTRQAALHKWRSWPSLAQDSLMDAFTRTNPHRGH